MVYFFLFYLSYAVSKNPYVRIKASTGSDSLVVLTFEPETFWSEDVEEDVANVGDMLVYLGTQQTLSLTNK